MKRQEQDRSVAPLWVELRKVDEDGDGKKGCFKKLSIRLCEALKVSGAIGLWCR